MLSNAAQLPQSIWQIYIRWYSIDHNVIEYNMEQSALDSRKTPLLIDAFWKKPFIKAQLSWEKWTQQWKLALLAKKGIQLERLLNGPPSAFT